tara:strand:- start:1172 stop:1450 length:279 start_codon:yes stop_codon:yes gene_type:complete
MKRSYSFEDEIKDDFFSALEKIVVEIVDRRFQVLEDDVRAKLEVDNETAKQDVADLLDKSEYIKEYELYDKVKEIIDDANITIEAAEISIEV